MDAIRRHINGRDLFQFLTDEGLIPNYAFPQQGVTLRSIIYREPLFHTRHLVMDSLGGIWR